MIQRSSILIVDDRHADRQTYCQYLGADDKLQLQLVVAESGQQGLELVRSETVPVVMLPHYAS